MRARINRHASRKRSAAANNRTIHRYHSIRLHTNDGKARQLRFERCDVGLRKCLAIAARLLQRQAFGLDELGPRRRHAPLFFVAQREVE